MTFVPARRLTLSEMHLLGNNVPGVFLRDRRRMNARDGMHDQEEYAQSLPEDAREPHRPITRP